MKKFFVIALILRLILAPMFRHPDVYDQVNWVKDLEKNGLVNFYNRYRSLSGAPNYPPVYFLIINANNQVYNLTKNTLWFANVNIPIFPSNLFLWFESDLGRIAFNKLLVIGCDIGIAYVIYLMVKELKDKKMAKKAILLYLFLPPSWYISSVWGQTDSIFLLVLMLSIYLIVVKKENFWSIVLFTISFLIKPLSILILPILIFYLLRLPIIRTLKASLLSFLIFISSPVLFGIDFTVSGIWNFYFNTVREISGFINSNAFNLWGEIYGFKNISDTTTLLGIQIFHWSLIINFILMAYLLYLTLKDGDNGKIKIFQLAIFSMISFMFLTKIHERYFYLSYILLLISTVIFKKLKPLFYLATIIFIFNLYHYWWVPEFSSLQYLLEQGWMEKILCLGNLFIFFKLLNYRKNMKIKSDNYLVKT